MLNKNVSETAVKVAKGVLKGIALVVIAGVLSSKSGNHKTTNCSSHSDYEYGDAVGAIMNSDMLDSDKTKVASVIQLNYSTEIYKAIVYVAESDMLSSKKRETILNICGQEEV